MPTCLLGIGSNLGDRRANLETAVRRLGEHSGIEVEQVSRWVTTTPLGGPHGQPEFLNGAARIVSSLSAVQLLAYAQQIEHELGRKRLVRWDARPIDIDILLYGDLVCDSQQLTIPHPWLAVRRFVLTPAAEIGGQLVHPLFGWSVERLSQHAHHQPPRFAVCNATPAEWQRLATQFQLQFGPRAIAISPPTESGRDDVDGVDGARSLPMHLAALQAANWNGDCPHAADASSVWLSGFWIPEVAARSNDRAHPHLLPSVSPWANEVASAKLVVVVVRDDATAMTAASPSRRRISTEDVRSFMGDPAACPFLAVADRGAGSWSDEVLAAITMMQT